MKNDMSGAAAVLAAMSPPRPRSAATTAVTGYLMCTDNMPSGTAMALGDVITMRGGTTVEVHEHRRRGAPGDGRRARAGRPRSRTDAIVDIATLTGACMRALGTQVAGVMGNDQGARRPGRGGRRARPTSRCGSCRSTRRYRSELDSTVADLKNLGGANAGAITAALFLAEFVGGVPWAHIDIAGTAQADGDAGWQTAGCTGFGARLLLQLALDFAAPGAPT